VANERPARKHNADLRHRLHDSPVDRLADQ
jgi:hypothetical protein